MCDGYLVRHHWMYSVSARAFPARQSLPAAAAFAEFPFLSSRGSSSSASAPLQLRLKLASTPERSSPPGTRSGAARRRLGRLEEKARAGVAEQPSRLRARRRSQAELTAARRRALAAVDLGFAAA